MYEVFLCVCVYQGVYVPRLWIIVESGNTNRVTTLYNSSPAIGIFITVLHIGVLEGGDVFSYPDIKYLIFCISRIKSRVFGRPRIRSVRI